MDAYAVILALLVGAMAVTCVNASYTSSDYARRERYALNGVLRPMGLPRVPASAAVIARDQYRERRGLVGSAILTGASILLVLPAGPPSFQALAFVLFAAAFVGRGIVIALLVAREGNGHRSSETAVSDARVRPLREWIPIWAWVAATLAQAGFLATYVPASLAMRPEMSSWVLGLGVVSACATVAGWVFASWLAVQPLLAGDADELTWSYAYRRRDLCTILAIGPLLAFGVAISAFANGGDVPAAEPVGHLPILAFGYALATGLFALLGHVRAGARPRSAVAGRSTRAES